VAAFFAASRADPGRITPDNAARYLAAYPPDGALFDGRPCVTCGFARPARSKHCRACGRCGRVNGGRWALPTARRVPAGILFSCCPDGDFSNGR
jgi:hypothetical protein